MTGRATKLLRAAAVALEGGRRIPASLGKDPRQFSVTRGFTIDKSGAYRFRPDRR